MLSKDELRIKIADLNKKENEIIAANPIRKLQANIVQFPKLTWGLAIACGAGYYFGPQYVSQITTDIAQYLLYAAGAIGALAVIFTLRWLIGGKTKTSQKYHDANEKLKEIRKQRGILEDQLKNG